MAAKRRNTSDASGGARAHGLDMRPLEEAPGFLLGRAWRDAQRRFERHFGHLKITAPQYAILLLLDLNEDCTPGALAAALGMGHNNLVTVLDDLVARGMVERTTCADDRRKRRLNLTPAGHEMLQRANEAERDNVAGFTARLGAANATRLMALLRLFEEP